MTTPEAATGPPRPAGDDQLLSVRDLKVAFATEEGVVQAVDGVSFDLAAGEILAVVGESGSGKSVSAMTLMGLTRSPNAKFEGTAHYKGTELITAPEDQLRRVRGAEIAMIFQDPMTSLNPVLRIGAQIIEQIQEHEALPDQQARERTIELMEKVGIPRARDRLDSYPHEFSGGMRQRVMIAIALSCNPSVLIADEPTTALDVTIQAQILERIRELRDETGAAVILVTHDLGVVADIADRIAVMYAGRIVEQGHPRRDLLRPPAPLHLGPARVDHARRPAAPRTAAGHRRPAALAVGPSGGLPLPAALPARVRQVQRGRRRSRRACRLCPSTSTAAGSTRRARSASCARSDPARSAWIAKAGAASA